MATVNVSIESNKYNPREVKIKVGDTVHWTNNHDIRHTVSFSNQTSDSINPGSTFDKVFSNVGSFGYYCNNDTVLSGNVIVE